MSKANEWTKRVAALTEDEHLRAQAARLMEPLRLIKGTANVDSYENVVSTVAQLVAVLEMHPDLTHTANNGGIMAVRGPLTGYSLMLGATDVFVHHLSPFRESMDYWNAGQERILAKNTGPEETDEPAAPKATRKDV